jgi:hypothetical protein
MLKEATLMFPSSLTAPGVKFTRHLFAKFLPQPIHPKQSVRGEGKCQEELEELEAGSNRQCQLLPAILNLIG